MKNYKSNSFDGNSTSSNTFHTHNNLTPTRTAQVEPNYHRYLSQHQSPSQVTNSVLDPTPPRRNTLFSLLNAPSSIPAIPTKLSLSQYRNANSLDSTPTIPPLHPALSDTNPSLKRGRRSSTRTKAPKIIRKRLFFDDKSDDLDPEAYRAKDLQYSTVLNSAIDIIRFCIEEGKSLVDLGELGLKTLPDEVVELKHLVCLISYRCISTNLSLYLNGNKFSTLPKKLFELDNLTVLMLSNNKLEELPQEILDLNNLTELSISGNLIKNLPSEILKLPKLEKVHLFPNPFLEPPRTFSNLELIYPPTNMYSSPFSSFLPTDSLSFYHLRKHALGITAPPSTLKSPVQLPSLFDLAARTLYTTGVRFSDLRKNTCDINLFFDRSMSLNPRVGYNYKNNNAAYKLDNYNSNDLLDFASYVFNDSNSCNLCAVCQHKFLSPSATVYVWCHTSWAQTTRIPISFNFCRLSCLQSEQWSKFIGSLRQ